RRIVGLLALKNAAIPLIGSISGWLASLLAGAFFIEFLFDWQGVGRLTVEAVLNNDVPLAMGCCLATTAIFVALHFVTEELYHSADPLRRSANR
ncbi:MAG: ABC transporter permease subunit, partial [Bacteroidia bacterium]|nr:ABC transporter permease subunit [Bacteroidia bacterium]